MAETIPVVDDPNALPRTSVPPGQFTYEEDIAPLQRRFFQQVESSPFLTGAQKDEQVFGLADRLNKLVDDRQKLRSQEQMMRMREMQYQSTMLHFETARSKFKEERDMLASLPSVTAELDAITTDPNMDHNTRRQALARWGLANAGILTKNPGAKVAYGAAQDAVRAQGEDPLSFAAKVTQLGLDPNSPYVASLPGATPEGIMAARQARQRIDREEDLEYFRKVSEKRGKSAWSAVQGLENVEFQTKDSGYDAEEVDVNKFKDTKSSTVTEAMMLYANSAEKRAYAAATTDRERFEVAKKVGMRVRMVQEGIDTRSATTKAFTEP